MSSFNRTVPSAAVLLCAIAWHSASGQCQQSLGTRQQFLASRAPSFRPGYQFASPAPTIDSIASQSYSRFSGADQSCSPQREAQLRRAAMMQARRDQESTRRKESRQAIPAKSWNDDQLADAKFRAARSLWEAGNADASRRWLQTLVRDYPNAQVADRAKTALARM
jgi:hypothetical protein